MAIELTRCWQCVDTLAAGASCSRYEDSPCGILHRCQQCGKAMSLHESPNCPSSSTAIPLVGSVSYHPAHWEDQQRASFELDSRYTGIVEVIFSRPAQEYNSPADLRKFGEEKWFLPDCGGKEVKGWVWTNDAGDKVESWIQSLWRQDIANDIQRLGTRRKFYVDYNGRAMVDEHNRPVTYVDKTYGFADMESGWFCVAHADRGYVDYNGRYGPVSDPVPPRRDLPTPKKSPKRKATEDAGLEITRERSPTKSNTRRKISPPHELQAGVEKLAMSAGLGARKPDEAPKGILFDIVEVGDDGDSIVDEEEHVEDVNGGSTLSKNVKGIKGLFGAKTRIRGD